MGRHAPANCRTAPSRPATCGARLNRDHAAISARCRSRLRLLAYDLLRTDKSHVASLAYVLGNGLGATPSNLATGPFRGNKGDCMATMSAAPGRDAAMTNEQRVVIFASSLGTVFEWYDFYIYGTLGVIL